MRFTDDRWRPRHVKLQPTKEKLTDATGLGIAAAHSIYVRRLISLNRRVDALVGFNDTSNIGEVRKTVVVHVAPTIRLDL